MDSSAMPRLVALKHLLNTLSLGWNAPSAEDRPHPWRAGAGQLHQALPSKGNGHARWRDIHVMGTLFSVPRAAAGDFGARWRPALSRLHQGLLTAQGEEALAEWDDDEDLNDALPALEEEEELILPDEPLAGLKIEPVREPSPPAEFAPAQTQDPRFQGLWNNVSQRFFASMPWQGGANVPVELRMSGETQEPVAFNPVAVATHSALRTAERLANPPPSEARTCGEFFRALPWQGRNPS